jgi:transcriptional regulator with XRE-family HTH domain/tetratricopeptide (TPR) repeat protein
MTAVSGRGPLGELLRQRRVQCGLTQEELAERAQISPRSVGDLERGVQLHPHPGTLRRLAEALELPQQERNSLLWAAGADGSVDAPGRAGCGSPSPGELAGREKEQMALARHLDGEGPPLLLFAGEPGIGKTRLLQEAASLAVKRGMRILSGGCDRRTGQDPYTPITQALHGYATTLSRSELGAALQGATWLVRMLPELQEFVVSPSSMGMLGPEQGRRLMFDSAVRFLAKCAPSTGLLLVMDDLQWAPRDALDLLSTVMQSATTVPMRAVGAFRHTEVAPDHALSGALGDLARAGLATVSPLVQLSVEEAAQLLLNLVDDYPALDSATMNDVVERSDGVPFFLVSYAQGLRSGAYGSGDPEPLPWSLVQTIRQRIAAMPPDTKDLLAAAAVIGRGVSASLLAAVTGKTDEGALMAMTAAWRAGLVEEGTARDFQFVHDVIRDTVEADLEAPRRMLLHRRVAEALEQLPEHRDERSAGALAWHFRRGDRPDRALQYALLAGDQAEVVCAHGVSEVHYRAALELAVELSDLPRQAEAGEKLGSVLTSTPRRSEARRVLHEACRGYRALDDLDGEARTTKVMAGLLESSQEGIDRLQPVLKRLEGRGASAGHGRLLDSLAYLFDLAGRPGDSLAAAARASTMARKLGDAQLLMDSENLRGVALIELGRVDEGLQVLEVVEDSITEADWPAAHVGPLQNAALGYILKGELGRAKQGLARALSLAEPGFPAGKGSAWASMAQNACTLGELSHLLALMCEWEDATTYVRRLEDILDTVDLQWDRPLELRLLVRGHIATARGEWGDGCRYLREGIMLCERWGDSYLLAPLHAALAELELLRGNHPAARECLESALKRSEVSESGVMALLHLLAWAHLEMGDAGRSFEVSDQAVDRARGHGMDLYLTDALWAKGLGESRLGRFFDGEQSLQAALQLARRKQFGRGEGRALYAHGLAAAERGEMATAKERLGQALAVFQRLRLQPYLVRTRQAISALG